jgi:DNA-binding response OmpR family regulator
MSNPVKILVIDDEEVGRQLLEAILTPENYHVIFGENGEQGLKLAASELPDIILCDVMMPGIDGFEVCKKIREDDSTRLIPIFLITALDDRDSKIRGIDAGADDYISKPLDRLEILAKIKNCLNRLKSRIQNNEETETQSHGNSIISPAILEGLVLSLSGDIVKDKYVELFRSSEIAKSKHLFSRRQYNDSVFYYLVSNTLNTIDAVILNCTLMSLLHQNSRDNTQSITSLFKEVLTQKEKIFAAADLNNESKVKISIVAIMKNTKKDVITCSGINHTLLINSNINESDSNAKSNFQPHHLNNNEDICLKKSDQIILFSPVVTNQVDQPELSTFINEEIDQNSKERITSKIADKISLTQDVLVVKLTF